MPKREKEVILYIKMEKMFKDQLLVEAKKIDSPLSSYCRTILIQSLKK
jgi:hypothetical protein